MQRPVRAQNRVDVVSREVVMVAAEDVLDPGAMDISLDQKKRREAKTDAAPE